MSSRGNTFGKKRAGLWAQAESVKYRAKMGKWTPVRFYAELRRIKKVANRVDVKYRSRVPRNRVRSRVATRFPQQSALARLTKTFRGLVKSILRAF